VSYDPVVAKAARAVAREFAPEYGARVEAEVETALYSAGETQPPSRFFDPVAVGELIVAVAALAWQVYSEIRSRGEKPAQDALERRIRVERRREVDLTTSEVKIIEIVSAEIIRLGDEDGDQ
jgi:hypothetical protein